MNQKSHLLQIFFFAIKNEFLLFKVNKQGKTNRLNDGRFPLLLYSSKSSRYSTSFLRSILGKPCLYSPERNLLLRYSYPQFLLY